MSISITSPGNFTTPVPVSGLTPVPATFLMCPPKLYDVNYVINPWMAGHVHDSSRAVAAEQWQHLYNAVTEIAEVVLVEPQPGSPDMVFTANAGLERDGIVVLSSFFHKERQGEEQHFRRWLGEAGYTVLSVPHETPFEGEGDALFAIDGSRLLAGYGPRTLQSSHRYLSDAWKIEVVPLHLIDPRFYHLDTCFAPLEDGSVMYYPPAFDKASVERIEDYYAVDKRIIGTEADALRFACNVINVNRTVILNKVSEALSGQLQSKGFHVVEVELSEFLKAGGAAKCLVMKLRGATC
ncbi:MULTISPECIES: dimethylarginine dimethylaminohydrolase family protein [Acidobacteriaceae]|uniref:dimethylarginine dimethylaminohydrolase family protein n=1 Tax=Acidobacteriaceae TaxID=204434 RepID=UPI00131CCA0F|nr:MULTISPECIES: arginine deiminase-related protein [Acidobacteriaceae]MDW5266528.1 arginine deiminase-related protein [Edaphobacter sp.]